ncbi:TetR/AcrR family transcriptional regulator [Nitrospirillum iridis]|uniref:AcrR family transcriptional regulator n=1 Tax=Nitrospirillum iridis TaxID=765888 RepID=A0A7X0EES9_9PROT|nr:TetR family transcriptional regulator [Nitrospirillum iridis]MBB6253335.1 AcrR family transcriptional regulator [Nitrospirillum iridis]
MRAALLALVETKPFEKITIRDICAQAGTGYATYFRHYPDTDTLLDDLAAEEIAQLLAHAMPITMSVDSRAGCRALCQYVAGHRQLWSTLLTGGAASRLREEFIRQARLAVPDATPSPDWLPLDLAIVVGTSSAIDVLAWWLAHGHDLSIEQIAEILDRLVVAPMTKG